MRRVFHNQTPAQWSRAPITALMAGLGVLPWLLWGSLRLLAKLGWTAEPPGGLSPALWKDRWALESDAWAEGQWWRLGTFPLADEGWSTLWTLPLLLLLGRALEPLLGTLRFGCVMLLGPLAGGMIQLALEGLALPWPSPARLSGWSCNVFALLGVYGAVLPDWPVGAATRWQIPGLRARHVPRLALGALLVGAFSSLGETLAPVALATACALGWSLSHGFGFGAVRPSVFHWGFAPSERHRLETMPWEDFVRLELDPILEKIARQGLQSLTRQERRVLKTGQRRLHRGGPAP